jgi:HEPN domain-containing protein
LASSFGLFNLKRTRHSLYFAHLALEKSLKAHICKVTNDLAPRIHSLLRLAEMAHLNLTREQLSFLARFDRYQIEGRYPDSSVSEPNLETTQDELEKVGEMIKWINAQFEK